MRNDLQKEIVAGSMGAAAVLLSAVVGAYLALHFLN